MELSSKLILLSDIKEELINTNETNSCILSDHNGIKLEINKKEIAINIQVHGE
jgi:hypothetical protein